MMERIRTGTMINKQISDQMLQILGGHRLGRFRTLLPQQIKHMDPHKPIAPVPAGKVIIASKGGTLRGGYIHEAAVLLLPEGRSVVLVMMTHGDPQQNERIMGQVAQAVYQALA